MKKAFRTRCYYTEYVNHMVRFYLTCPDALKTAGKKRADIENWCAVQTILHRLSESDREMVVSVYKTDFFLPKAVAAYCQETGTDEHTVWSLLTKTASQIAKCRGLI